MLTCGWRAARGGDQHKLVGDVVLGGRRVVRGSKPVGAVHHVAAVALRPGAQAGPGQLRAGQALVRVPLGAPHHLGLGRVHAVRRAADHARQRRLADLRQLRYDAERTRARDLLGTVAPQAHNADPKVVLFDHPVRRW